MNLLVVIAAVALNGTLTNTPPIIVEASRIGSSVESIPSRAEVYNAKDIIASGASSIAEFLTKRSNLGMRTLNSNPLLAQLSMRGYGENSFGRVKIILDGEELNSAEAEAPNLMRVPLDQVDRVEIMRGPQSVLYGDGASAGVINIETSKSYKSKTRMVAKGGSQGTFGGSVRHSGGIESEGITYNAGYEYLRSNGHRDHAGYQTHNVAGSLRKTATNGAYVGFKANYAHGLYEMPSALYERDYREDHRRATYKDAWCRYDTYSLAMDSKVFTGDDTQIKFDIGFNQKNRHAKWGDFDYATDYALYTTKLNPKLINDTTLFDYDNHIILGIDLTWERYDIVNGSEWMPRNPFFDRLRSGIYAHDEFYLTEELSFIIGARLERIGNRWEHYSDSVDGNNDYLEPVFEIGTVYHPTDSIKTYLKATRFFRAPFCDEMNYTAGEQLETENGYSVDLGFDCEFLDNFNAFFDGYGTWTKDEIFYNPYHTPTPWGWSGYNCNSPSPTRRLGFDTGLEWKRKDIARASVRYGFVNAIFTEGQYGDNEVPLVPRDRIRTEAGWSPLSEIELRVGVNYIGAQRFGSDFMNENHRLGAYSTIDLGATYRPRWANGFEIAFDLNNVLDELYCDYAGFSTQKYYYPAAGRSFMITLRYSF